MLSSLVSWRKKLYILSFFAIFIIIFLFPNSSKAQKEEQQQVETQNQTQLSKEPEWDGVYVVDNLGNYHELIPLSKGEVKKFAFNERTLHVKILPKDVNHVSWNNFKGFFFKGQQFIQEIKINKAQAANIIGPNIEDRNYNNYLIREPENNLYVTQMRCKTKLDSSYCEFKNNELAKEYLTNTWEYRMALRIGKRIPFYLSIRIGESLEKGGKVYIISFEE
jgi:hypothetical protein